MEEFFETLPGGELSGAPAHVRTYDPRWPQMFMDASRYDWDDARWKRKNRGKNAYRIIPLTQGYFALVSPCDYKRLTTFADGSPKRWHAKIQKDKEGNLCKVYASRRGRAKEPCDVYMHREILDFFEIRGAVGDHINGYGLDNRRVNLRRVKRGVNNSNVRQGRDLPVGVEQLRNGRYKGIHSVRLGKRLVKTVRSKRSWLSPEPAAKWYRNRLKRLHKHVAWAHDPGSVSYPVLPPSIDSEPLVPRRPKGERRASHAEIPF